MVDNSTDLEPLLMMTKVLLSYADNKWPMTSSAVVLVDKQCNIDLKGFSKDVSGLVSVNKDDR